MGIAELGFTITTVMITITFTHLFLSIRSIIELLKAMIDANTERHNEVTKYIYSLEREIKSKDTEKIDMEGIHQRLNSIVTLITNAFPPPNLSEYDFVPPKKREKVSLSVAGRDDLILERKSEKEIVFFVDEAKHIPKINKKKSFFYERVLDALSFTERRKARDVVTILLNQGERTYLYKVQAVIPKLKKDGLISGSEKEGGYVRIKYRGEK
jgi:hypothetical protein